MRNDLGIGVLEYERIYFEVVIQTENGLYRGLKCWSTNGYTSKWLLDRKWGIGGLWRVEYEGYTVWLFRLKWVV